MAIYAVTVEVLIYSGIPLILALCKLCVYVCLLVSLFTYLLSFLFIFFPYTFSLLALVIYFRYFFFSQLSFLKN